MIKRIFPDNIRYLRNKNQLSQEAMALKLDLTRSQIASYEDGRAEPNLQTLIRYSDYFKLPIDALLKNDLTIAQDGAFLDIGHHRILFPVLINEENEDLIEVVPIKASAGYLGGYGDPDYISQLPQMTLPFLPTGKHRAFPIKGDSMEPGVRDGSFVVGKFLEDISQLVSGRTYVVVTRDEGLSYKRLDTSLIKNGSLILESDNKQYPNYEVRVGDILELWEFTCKIDIQDYDPEELNLSSIAQMMRGFQIELEQIKTNLNQPLSPAQK